MSQDYETSEQIKTLCILLRPLAGAATHHEWVVDTADEMGKNWCIGSVIECGMAETANGQYSNFIVTTEGVPASELKGGTAQTDAQFIAAANPVAITQLLDEIQRLQDALRFEQAAHEITANKLGLELDEAEAQRAGIADAIEALDDTTRTFNGAYAAQIVRTHVSIPSVQKEGNET